MIASILSFFQSTLTHIFEGSSNFGDFRDSPLGKSNLSLAYAAVAILFGAIYVIKVALSREKSKEVKEGLRKIPQVNKLLSWLTPFDLVYYFLKLRKVWLYKYLDGMHMVEQYTAKYGNVFKIKSIGMQHYVISDPDVIQKLLSSTDPSYQNKPSYLRKLCDLVQIQGGLFTAGGSKWSSRRRLMNRSFTYKSLQSYLGTMNKNAKNMVEQMTTELYSSTQDFDQIYFGREKMSKIQHLCTIKTASSIIMGADVFTEEESVTFREDFRNAKDMAVFRLYRPWTIYDIFFRLYPERDIFMKGIAGFRRFINILITRYKEEYEKLKTEGKIRIAEEPTQEDISIGLRPQRSMIEELISGGLTDEEILEELVVFMIGGHETTTTAIHSLMLHLALNPNEQTKCHEEVDEVFKSHDELKKDVELTMDDLTNLKYLERCFLECLRLTPSIPMFQRGMEKPFKVEDDFIIEEGSNVLINMWVVHRDPKYFPDPLKFDPDRFLPENIAKTHKFAYLPFSLGLRNCIAWKMSLMEVKVVMAWLLRNFEISLREPMQFKDIQFMYELTIKAKNDINFVFKRRKI